MEAFLLYLSHAPCAGGTYFMRAVSHMLSNLQFGNRYGVKHVHLSVLVFQNSECK